MNHALKNEEPVELWHVEVAPNDVRIVTLEQLDEAFQQGLVNERTRVFQDGMDEPAFLGELLGLGDDEDEAEEPVQAAPAVSRNHQNTLVGLPAAPPAAAQTRSAPPPQAAPRSVHPAAASAYPPIVQAAQSQRPVQSAPPPGPQSYRPQSAPPPMTAQTFRQVQSAPPQSQVRRSPVAESAWPPVVARPSAAPTPSAVVAPSVVPMALDLSDDSDLEFPRPKRTGKVLLVGVGMLAVAAAVGLAVTGKGSSLLNSLTASSTASMAVMPAKKAPPPVEEPKSHALDVGTAPIKLKEAPPPLVITTRENEATALAAAGTAPSTTSAAADTALAKSSSSKNKAPKAVASKRAKSAPKSSSGAAPKRGSGGGLKGGGGMYDPLNGNL
jgi:hypothetical protein